MIRSGTNFPSRSVASRVLNRGKGKLMWKPFHCAILCCSNEQGLPCVLCIYTYLLRTGQAQLSLECIAGERRSKGLWSTAIRTRLCLPSSLSHLPRRPISLFPIHLPFASSSPPPKRYPLAARIERERRLFLGPINIVLRWLAGPAPCLHSLQPAWEDGGREDNARRKKIQ